MVPLPRYSSDSGLSLHALLPFSLPEHHQPCSAEKQASLVRPLSRPEVEKSEPVPPQVKVLQVCQLFEEY